jgi:hypothetical protein
MQNIKKRRNHVVPWLFCSIVVVISIFYLFSPENIISGEIEVKTMSLIMVHKGAKSIRKRQVAIKPKVTRKISKNKTVEPSKISKNETVVQSKISENKKVKPSDDSKYQSEYTYNCHAKILVLS